MITSEQLALVAGVVLSLLAFYLPVFGPWYEKQEAKVKAQIMGAAIIVVGLASFVLAYACVGPFCLGTDINWVNALWQIAMTIAITLSTNQATYMAVKRLRD